MFGIGGQLVLTMQEWLKYKLYIFDLDDTLYRETDYLFAAYRRIAHKAADADDTREIEYWRYLCNSFMVDGRELLFQRFQSKYSLQMDVAQMLSILHHTECKLKLFPSARHLVNQLLINNKNVAILTNGNTEQQKQKVINLNIRQIWPQVTIVYAGEIAPKPSPIPIQQLMVQYQTQPSETIFIGDSVTDEQTSLNAGIDYIKACYLIK